jgi:hypothetical protein
MRADLEVDHTSEITKSLFIMCLPAKCFILSGALGVLFFTYSNILIGQNISDVIN